MLALLMFIKKKVTHIFPMGNVLHDRDETGVERRTCYKHNKHMLFGLHNRLQTRVTSYHGALKKEYLVTRANYFL